MLSMLALHIGESLGLQVFYGLWLTGTARRSMLEGTELQEAAVEFEFTLRYRIENNVDDALEHLAAAECKDALVGIGHQGQLCLEFRRNAASEAEAIASAKADVERALPTSVLIER